MNHMHHVCTQMCVLTHGCQRTCQVQVYTCTNAGATLTARSWLSQAPQGRGVCWAAANWELSLPLL